MANEKKNKTWEGNVKAFHQARFSSFLELFQDDRSTFPHFTVTSRFNKFKLLRGAVSAYFYVVILINRLPIGRRNHNYQQFLSINLAHSGSLQYKTGVSMLISMLKKIKG